MDQKVSVKSNKINCSSEVAISQYVSAVMPHLQAVTAGRRTKLSCFAWADWIAISRACSLRQQAVGVRPRLATRFFFYFTGQSTQIRAHPLALISRHLCKRFSPQSSHIFLSIWQVALFERAHVWNSSLINNLCENKSVHFRRYVWSSNGEHCFAETTGSFLNARPTRFVTVACLHIGPSKLGFLYLYAFRWSKIWLQNTRSTSRFLAKLKHCQKKTIYRTSHIWNTLKRELHWNWSGDFL